MGYVVYEQDLFYGSGPPGQHARFISLGLFFFFFRRMIEL